MRLGLPERNLTRSKVLAENLSLIGFMGSGKSTVGPLVALSLGMTFIELDMEVERMAGSKIPDIFEKHGEPFFRRLEARALGRVLRGRGRVLSCGGGVILSRTNVNLLRRKSLVILLRISPETALSRLEGCLERPLVAEGGRERIIRLYREREDLYLEAAHHVVLAEGRSPSEVAGEIASAWKGYCWN